MIQEVWVTGVPKPQPRPRAFKTRAGAVRVFDPATAEGWKAAIATAVRQYIPSAPAEGPLYLGVDFFMPRPATLSRKKDPDQAIPHASRPDIDNCIKACLDCLQALGFFRDDCQVCEVSATKLYARKGGAPGARLTLRSLHVSAKSNQERRAG